MQEIFGNQYPVIDNIERLPEKLPLPAADSIGDEPRFDVPWAVR